MATKKSTRSQTDAAPVFAVIAAVLAWAVPGLGHVFLGRYWRGLIIFVVIAAMFWAGVAMGGVMTVDREGEPWWFMAQMLTGAQGILSWQRSQSRYDEIVGAAGLHRPGRENRMTLADAMLWRQIHADAELEKAGIALATPTDTVARAYSGVAGLLNLMCIFDAGMLALLGIRGEKRRTAAPEAAA